MTTAAQRIWEAIYAAEFVRVAAAIHGQHGPMADQTGYAASQARCAADDHADRLGPGMSNTRPASRFRKRAR